MTRLSRRQVVQGAGAVGLGLLAGCGRWPGQGQAPPKLARLGILWPSNAESVSQDFEALQQGLHALGYIEGHSISFEHRYAGGAPERLGALATELVSVPVDIIITDTNPGTAAAKSATSTLPIVMTLANDPVGNGFVASLARPGGNVTGLATISSELSGKRLELLSQTLPNVRRLAILWDASNLSTQAGFQATHIAAESLGLELQSLPVREGNEIAGALDAAKSERADGLIVVASALTGAHRRQIVELARSHQLPDIHGRRENVVVGGLMAYGASYTAISHRAAYYVDRILKGAKPADLPIEQPREFDFVINLKTAQALGLTIPHHVLLQATEVIQ
jgi:putative tryptophan/tyrosine transport system substrate-binding protein